jgi:hypothetical protein
MRLNIYIWIICLSTVSCYSASSGSCDKDGKNAKRGRALNEQRLKYGIPIIHDYLCFDRWTGKVEGWDAPISYQLSTQRGFHAGKGVFLTSDAEMDEKDIYRKRVNDSTFAMLGISTEVYNGVTSFNVWYGLVDLNTILNKQSNRQLEVYRKDLTIQQADSILGSWETSRK